VKLGEWISLTAILSCLGLALANILPSVHAAFSKPSAPVPVVFTSRAKPVSFLAAMPVPSENYPGTRVPRAIPGKLRVLEPGGNVRELTWGKSLPGGGTIFDVMSPSVSQDGQKIVFAGITKRVHRMLLYMPSSVPST